MREFFGGAKSAGFDWARVLNSVVPCRERSELWSLWRGISVEPPLNGAALHSAVTVDLQSQPFRAFLHHSKQADRFGFRPCSSCNAGTAAQAQQHRPTSRSTLRTENCQSRTRGTVFCILFGTPHLPELTPADLNPSYPPSGIPPRTRQKYRQQHQHWHTPKSKMKIVESQSALLSNFEVYQHIADQRRRNKTQNRRVPANAHHVMNEVRSRPRPPTILPPKKTLD